VRIIYFDMDSCRPDHLGCYGYHRATSPNIDRVAAEGVVFTNCYASDAPCLPSRTALFSGRFGIHNGVVGHGGAAARMRYPGDGHRTDPAALPLAMALSRHGHRATTFTTFAERHLAWHFYAGWDEIQRHSPKNGNETADEVNAALLPWLRARGRDGSYFLHVNYWDPHVAYRTPMAYGNPFENDPAPDWMTEAILAEQWASYGPNSARDLKNPQYVAQFPRHPLQVRTLDDFKRWIDGYDVGVRFMDDHIGQVLDVLADLGVLEDTALLFSADHGENLGELNVYGDHETADHLTSRVPLIVRWPGVTKPGQVDAPVYQLDLAPTLTELTGAPTPDRWDGRSLAPALAGEAFPGRPYLVLGQGAWTCQRAVRVGSQLFVRTYHPGLRPVPEVMLFDVEADPHETNDLAAARPEDVARCDHLLMEWWQECLTGPEAARDPMLSVIEEGGPFYVRHLYQAYAEHLRQTERPAAAAEVLRRARPAAPPAGRPPWIGYG
jgi:choline-sulfatase